MAISPPSDIVLDVARAVEPTDIATARAELMRKAQAAGAAPFSLDVSGVSPGAYSGLSRASQPMSSRADETAKKFEAAVLQTFISSMMPKNAESVYGKGMAGDMWKSMMSEKIAGVMAEGGGIGIADMISKNFTVDENKNVIPVAGITPESQLQFTQPTEIAGALMDQIQKQAVNSITDGTPMQTGLFKK